MYTGHATFEPVTQYICLPYPTFKQVVPGAPRDAHKQHSYLGIGEQCVKHLVKVETYKVKFLVGGC